MIQVIYRVRDGKELLRKVDYIQTTDFKYAIDLFLVNHGLSQPQIVALIRID